MSEEKMKKIAQFLNNAARDFKNFEEFQSEITKSDYAAKALKRKATYYALAQLNEKKYLTVKLYTTNDDDKIEFVSSDNHLNQLGKNGWVPYDKKNLKKDMERYLHSDNYKIVKVLKLKK